MKSSVLIVAVLVALAAALCCVPSVSAGPSDPESRTEDWWWWWHDIFKVNTANNPGIPIVFYGDSVTQGWLEDGLAVFNQYYEPLGAENYAIGGDRVEHIHWRAINGEVDGLNPKLIVLCAGVNNIFLGEHANRDIADGVGALVSTFRTRFPNTKILLLGILPGESAWLYEHVLEVNSYLRHLHNGESIFFLDMFASFTSDTWGSVIPEYFTDGVHLSEAGYQKWADVMNPLFNQLRN